MTLTVFRYSSNGAQINSPIDLQIANSIQQNLEPWPTAWRGSDNESLSSDLYDAVKTAYCESISKFVTSTVDTREPPSPFVYTPLHGVGYPTMSALCDQFGINNMIAVSEQKEPDPDFPTVRFPNPEESGALDLAMKTADDSGVNIIVANDPDADRFAVAEKVDGTWFKFTGDQVGVLLAFHLLDGWKRKEASGASVAMLNTAVSTGMLAKMAEKEGFFFQETLTGFKWLGNAAKTLETRGHRVPFAFEEALGYMFTEVCYDKDGLTAAMVFLAAQANWRKEGLTPYAKLQQLYEAYGYHETLNTYFISPDADTSNILFRCIRNRPEEELNIIGSLSVTRWRDVTNGFDTGAVSSAAALPTDSTSQMLTIWSTRGIRFTLRASGTEPKIKIYIESCCASREDAIAAVCEALSAVVENWIKPFAPSVTYTVSATTSSGHKFSLS